MISSPLPPSFTASHDNPTKLRTENEYPSSPKHDPNQSSLLELKRRCIDTDVQPSKRALLNPLAASHLENKLNRNSQTTDSVSYHSLVTPSSHPDSLVLLPDHPVSSGSCRMQRSDASGALVCSWPPPTPTPGTGQLLHSSRLAKRPSSPCPLHSLDEEDSSRATFLDTTCTCWYLSDFSQTEPTTTMNTPTRTTGWRSENVLQPIRSRTHSLPSVRRPPGELWQSDCGPTKAVHAPVAVARSLMCPTPPGLPSRRSELRRSSSVSDLLPHNSISLSLALGSQPLRASEHTKAVPPIGAERSRVVSTTSLKSHIQNPPLGRSNDLRRSLWRSSPLSPGLESKWKDGTCVLDVPSQATVQPAAGHASLSRARADLECHAIRNKHAPKIASPLSPLRAETPVKDPSVDPAYRLCMLSPRYTTRPPVRARTICDVHQSLDWDTTCMHCQECKRDTVGKRLLAFRHRQQQQQQQQQQQTRHVQRLKLLGRAPLLRVSTMSSVDDDDRIALAGRIREVFAYEVDEEKRLYEEVAAVVGDAPVPLARVRLPCAVVTRRRSVGGGSDDEDYLETLDEGLLATESASLFRDVSVY